MGGVRFCVFASGDVAYTAVTDDSVFSEKILEKMCFLIKIFVIVLIIFYKKFFVKKIKKYALTYIPNRLTL